MSGLGEILQAVLLRMVLEVGELAGAESKFESPFFRNRKATSFVGAVQRVSVYYLIVSRFFKTDPSPSPCKNLQMGNFEG